MMLRALLTASWTLLFVVSQSPAQTLAQPASPLTLTQVWTLDTTYTDHQHGVTFRYPSTWKATTQFGYHPPALTESDAAPIAGFGYSDRGDPRGKIVAPYAGTNLEGVGIVYSAVPAASAVECEARAAGLSSDPTQRSKSVFGDRPFSVYKTGDAGMSQSISGQLYATYVGSTCYLFETDTALSSPGVDDVQALTPAQIRYIDAHLLNIMKSVRIVPSERTRD